MTIGVYSFDDGQLQEFTTAVFTETIRGLVKNGELDQGRADQILDSYAMLRVRKGWFGRAIDRWFSSDEGSNVSRFSLVRVNAVAGK